MENSKATVRIQNRLSPTFTTSKGVRQGDGLAPILFNIVLEKVIREAIDNTGGSIINKSHQVIGYADDINLVARSEREIKESYRKIETQAQKVGLQVNEQKTKMLTVKPPRRIGQNFTVEDKNFEVVQQFKYLGVQINSENKISQEIQLRVTAGNRTYFSLMSIFKASYVTRITKLKIYKAIIRPVVTYGCQTWTMTKDAEETLLRFERRILRRIFGPVQEEGMWRIRYNFELRQLYKEANIVEFAKLLRLKWAGHVERMDDHRIPKKIHQGQIEGRRTRGRPRQRWSDNIEEDARQILNTQNWKFIAQDREE